MISKKTQTIQGFLTPTKLLSGIVKSTKPNQKASKSPVNISTNKLDFANSRFNSHDQSILSTSKDIESRTLQIGDTTNNSRLTGDLDKYDYQHQQIHQKKYESEKQITAGHFADREMNRNTFKNVSIPIIQEDEVYHNNERTLQEIGVNQFQRNLNPSRVSNQSPSSIWPQNQNISSLPLKSTQKNSQTSQLMAVQCYQLIRKLSKVKQSLQLEISQLQLLLDNTSKHMQNMQDDFQKIKVNILTYTARCLDNAFMEYKQSMVEWQKYEQFERKSLNIVNQLNEYIYHEQQKLSQESKKHSYRQMTIQALQIQKKIQYYSNFALEIKEVRQQCVSMRPTLTQDKIRQFQKGVQILCSF